MHHKKQSPTYQLRIICGHIHKSRDFHKFCIKRKMSKTGKLLSLLLFLQLVFLAESGGMTVKLIHRHSPDSPFYPGDISRTERIKLSIQAASMYASRLSSSNSIWPRMDNQDLQYLVQVGIGTFARPNPQFYNYFLHFDTASDLMWTQCAQCQKVGSCFLQKAPLFPAQNSTAYHPLPCDRHPLCTKGMCLNQTCTYSMEYADGANTSGFLAYESLTFNSINNRTETVKGVVFGCGIRNRGFQEESKNNLVAGNFGLGPGAESFLKQKQALTLGMFSYCLTPWDAPRESTIFLRFGADVPPRKGLKVTPLMTKPHSASYFVNLQGVSVGRTRISAPSARTAGRGGCILDSGSAVTVLPPRVYQKLKKVLINNHFSKYKITKNQQGLDFCYLFPPNTGLNDLPGITFHLQDADLVVPPHLVFEAFDKSKFCLAMISGDVSGMVIVGAQQQANKHFVFDTLNSKLYFGEEDCTRGV